MVRKQRLMAVDWSAVNLYSRDFRVEKAKRNTNWSQERDSLDGKVRMDLYVEHYPQ